MPKKKKRNADFDKLLEKIIEAKLKSIVEEVVEKTIEALEKREVRLMLKSRYEKNPIAV